MVRVVGLGGSGWPWVLRPPSRPGGQVLPENLRKVRRTVNPERDLGAQAMLEMLERHGSRAGTVFASSLHLSFFRLDALPVKWSNWRWKSAACAANLIQH